jgi:SAM-dependent methyltransferase
MSGPAHDELRGVAERYARRRVSDRYDPLRPEVWQSAQERQRALIDLIKRHATAGVSELKVLEVGCGGGDNLLELIRLGFDPAFLMANELLPERAAQARHRLPAAVAFHEGDATALKLPPASVDIVLQSTVFSSVLDDAFQQRLADAMWGWVRPGGAVLWHDFTVDNPRNRDVRGVPLARVRALFPEAELDVRRITLVPPLARRVCAVHPALYRVLNVLPLLRTHVLVWAGKPRTDNPA